MAKLHIDGYQLLELLSEQLVKESGAFSKGVNKGLNIARSLIRNPDAVQPIDPETIPVVRQLREELARVKVERDDYKELFLSYRNVCGCHDPQRISELVEADKDGRCVVLPCHIGDQVYYIANVVSQGYPDPDIKPELFLRPFKIEWIYGIGKFVFTDRESAEAALARRTECSD